jgi:hypothetical protein
MRPGCHREPRSPAPDELLTEIVDQILMPLIRPMRPPADAAA